MTRFRPLVLAASALILTVAGATPSLARDNDRNYYDRYDGYYQNYNHPGYGHGRDYDDRGRNDNRYTHGRGDRYNYWNINLSSRQRDQIGREFYKAYSNQCGNHARFGFYNCSSNQYYNVGYKLAPNVVTWNLPGHVLRELPRPHQDTRYVWVGRDILLVAKCDGTVLDRVISLR